MTKFTFAAALAMMEIGCVSHTTAPRNPEVRETSNLAEPASFATRMNREVISARMVSDFALRKNEPKEIIARFDRVFKANGDSFDVSDCVVTGKAKYPGGKQNVILNIEKITCNEKHPKVAPATTFFALDRRGTIGVKGTFDVATTIEAISNANLNPQVALIRQQDALNTEILSMREPFMIVSDGGDIFSE